MDIVSKTPIRLPFEIYEPRRKTPTHRIGREILPCQPRKDEIIQIEKENYQVKQVTYMPLLDIVRIDVMKLK